LFNKTRQQKPLYTAFNKDSNIMTQTTIKTPLSLEDRQLIANILTWDRDLLTSPDEIISIAVVKDIVSVKLNKGAYPLSVAQFQAIRAALSNPSSAGLTNPNSVDSDDFAPMEISGYHDPSFIFEGCEF
jgi:hypothetical protein